jgi:hypothetical protein
MHLSEKLRCQSIQQGIQGEQVIELSPDTPIFCTLSANTSIHAALVLQTFNL